MTLVGASSEYLIIEQAAQPPLDATGSFPTTFPGGIAKMVRAFVGDWLSAGPMGAPTWVDTSPTNLPDFQYNAAVSDYWDLFWDGTSAAGLDLYDDGLGVWHIEPFAEVSADIAHDLSVGAGGTITASDAGLDRDAWANVVGLAYAYDETVAGVTTGRYQYGRASVTAGPYSTALAGTKYLVEVRQGQPSIIQANAAANQLLRRLLSRSRSLSIEAVAAWWLRPGHTVTAQLVTGAQERHLVSGVTFRPGGRMTVVTRLPDTVSTIGE